MCLVSERDQRVVGPPGAVPCSDHNPYVRTDTAQEHTHSQSQTVAIMTTLKNSLILITLCLGLAAAQEEAGEARLLFSNYTSGTSNTILWKTLLRGDF